jgi:AcrR family transcriptional regulator
MGRPRSTETKERLLEAAISALAAHGFARTSSRVVAERAGANQALVFYYFGSLDSLLLAALDATSEARLARYREAVATAATLPELLRVVPEVYREDRDSGHMTVVSQLVAGSLARPDLRPQVLARIEPWLAFAEEAIGRALAGTPLEGLAPVEELASAVITFYFGVNLLTSLDDGRRTDALFERLEQLAPLADALGRG